MYADLSVCLCVGFCVGCCLCTAASTFCASLHLCSTPSTRTSSFHCHYFISLFIRDFPARYHQLPLLSPPFNFVTIQTVYDAWLMIIFNIVYTSAPIVNLALWDMDVPAEVAFRNIPDVYCRSKDSEDFSLLVCLSVCLSVHVLTRLRTHRRLYGG